MVKIYGFREIPLLEFESPEFDLLLPLMLPCSGRAKRAWVGVHWLVAGIEPRRGRNKCNTWDMFFHFIA